MEHITFPAGATSQSMTVFIGDLSSNDGTGKTGLAFDTASLTCYSVVPGAAAAAVTLATLATPQAAWSSGGFKEVDATNMPGVYRFDIPDALIASAGKVTIVFRGAADMMQATVDIEVSPSVAVASIANGAIAAATFAAGAIDATAIAAGAIAADAFAAGAIDAAAIAADAIDASALKADAVAEIWAYACTEPAAVVASAPTAIAALSWLLTMSRNKLAVTATSMKLKADDGSTDIATSTISDDGTTFSRGEYA